jgi:hypothetical protein
MVAFGHYLHEQIRLYLRSHHCGQRTIRPHQRSNLASAEFRCRARAAFGHRGRVHAGVSEGRRKEWIESFYGKSYFEIEDSSVVFDIMDYARHRCGLDVYQCEACGRIYIEREPRQASGSLRCFKPKDVNWRGTLAVQLPSRIADCNRAPIGAPTLVEILAIKRRGLTTLYYVGCVRARSSSSWSEGIFISAFFAKARCTALLLWPNASCEPFRVSGNLRTLGPCVTVAVRCSRR